MRRRGGCPPTYALRKPVLTGLPMLNAHNSTHACTHWAVNLSKGSKVAGHTSRLFLLVALVVLLAALGLHLPPLRNTLRFRAVGACGNGLDFLLPKERLVHRVDVRWVVLQSMSINHHAMPCRHQCSSLTRGPETNAVSVSNAALLISSSAAASRGMRANQQHRRGARPHLAPAMSAGGTRAAA